VRTHSRKKLNMLKALPGFKRLNADIPEELFKEFAKRCIEEGMSKKDFLFSFWRKNSLRIQKSRRRQQNKRALSRQGKHPM